MKTFFFLLLIAFINQAFAQGLGSKVLYKNECDLREYFYEIYTSKSKEVELSRRIIEASSKRECFQKALNFAKSSKYDFNEKRDATMYAERDVIVLYGYMYVTWEYNDGYFNDSDGAVTKNTPSCLSQSMKIAENDILNSLQWEQIFPDNITGNDHLHLKNCEKFSL